MFEVFNDEEVGRVISWSVDVDEDRENIRLYNNLVLSRKFEQWLEKTIINNGSSGKLQIATTSKCNCTVIMCESMDCTKARTLVLQYQQKNLSRVLNPELQRLLFAHLAVCENQYCPAREIFLPK